jgi:hypothetical protein
MLRITALGFAVATALSLAAVTPGLADISTCTKLPDADTCPTMGPPTQSNASQQVAPKHLRHAHYRYEPTAKQKKG